MRVLRAGQTAAFVWGITTAQYTNFSWFVRFTDDAGLEWQIDNLLHLRKLDSRDW